MCRQCVLRQKKQILNYLFYRSEVFNIEDVVRHPLDDLTKAFFSLISDVLKKGIEIFGRYESARSLKM